MEKKSRVFKIKEMKPMDRGPGLKGWPLVTGETGSEHLTTGITEFQPGASLAMHIHNCEEQVTVIEGKATAVIDGISHPVTAPDTTFIFPGVPHRFINSSDRPMKILWVYTTTRVTRTFVDPGKTGDDLKR
ncbi:MAG: cupin domain-containing protein [Planctomycetaceae bacterium]